MSYPQGFPDWPEDQRNAYFADKARAYTARQNGTNPRDTPAPKTKATLRRASDLTPVPITWLWPGWLASGKMHIIGGQPGAGKTTLAMAMAAIVSAGANWPDGRCSKRGNVIIWSGEDDPADTLLPRLAASGADASQVYFVENVLEDGKPRSFDPAKDTEALRSAIVAAGGARLLVIDPIVSAVAGDSHKNSETRRSLQPLADLAAEVGAALIGVTHFSKGTSGREPTERITGSIAFAALARVVMIAAKEADGEDGEAGRRILMRAKSNIGPDEGGFAYELRQEPMPGHPDIVASIAVIGETVKGTARDMLAAAEAQPEDNGAVGDAVEFLRDILSVAPQSVRELKAAAEAHGHSWRAIERAKKQLGVIAQKIDFKTGWKWLLPEDDGGVEI
mgnify:CR=1 FL=1